MIAGKRAALAALLSTVDGVQGCEKRPGTPRVGDAWAQWRGAERAAAQSFTETWVIFVVLPGDLSGDAATTWIDAHLEDLVFAVDQGADGGFVDSVTPVQLTVGDAGEMPALQMIIRSE